MERINTNLENLQEVATKAGISSKKLSDAAPNYSLPNGKITFTDVEVVVFDDKPKMNHISITAKDEKDLMYTISVGRLQFSGIPASETTKEEAIKNIKKSESNVYYLPGTRANNWLQNNQIEACKQLIGNSFEVENIEMLALNFNEDGYKTTPKVKDLVVKQVPKLTPIKA